MVTSITMIRHALSDVKAEGEPRIPGPGLSNKGRDQATKLKKFLQGFSFSKVYCSNMKRAIETVKVISDKEPLIAEEFSEFNKIVFEEEHDAVEKQNENIVFALKTRAFFEELLRKNRDSSILMVSHGNVIRYLICISLKLKPHLAPNIFIDNASITRLFFDGEKLISIGCVNSTNHLLIKN